MQVSKKKAIEIYNSKALEDLDKESLFLFQISQKRLCVDFSKFHEAAEKALNRPVFTHEFARPETLLDEYLKRLKGGQRDIIATEE